MTIEEIHTRIYNASSDLWVVSTFAEEIKSGAKPIALVAEQLKNICHLLDTLANAIED